MKDLNSRVSSGGFCWAIGDRVERRKDIREENTLLRGFCWIFVLYRELGKWENR